MLTELSLFSGAGGGLLASKLLGWRTVGYVEYNDYCQRVIKQRIEDGILDEAPIFGDIRAFISEGYASSYQGLVDVVSGGFPCQPFSLSGKQLRELDDRNMWPETREVIRVVRPKFAFLENVPGLLNCGYFGRILGDLAEMGLNARWGVLGADCFGLPHHRARVWLVAYAKGVNGKTWDMLETCRRWGAKRKFGRLPSISLCQKRWKANQGFGDISVFRNPNDGMASEVGERHAIGNGQVPIVAATAFKLLSGGLV
jgi:DNA (cytosine-5)-methyltransferase 1